MSTLDIEQAVSKETRRRTLQEAMRKLIDLREYLSENRGSLRESNDQTMQRVLEVIQDMGGEP